MSNKLTATDYNKMPMREHRKNQRKHKKHLEQIANEGNEWVPGSYGVDKDGHYTNDPEQVVYYKRTYRSQRSKDIKKQCNEQVRNDDDELYQGGNYKKAAEFWWNYD